jgi:myosin heavy subunit
MSSVYVRDELLQWLPATVLKRERDRVCIQVDRSMECGGPKTPSPRELREGSNDGGAAQEVKWLDLHHFQANSLPRGDAGADCGDVAQLHTINEAEILHYLTRRFIGSKAYTRCGDLLLVLHPLTLSSSLYDHETKTKYFDHVNGTLLFKFDASLLMLL